jgi:uncharacterized repeat protein (TIGR01451 family)
MLIKQQLRRVRLAVVALGLVSVAQSVFAAGGDTKLQHRHHQYGQRQLQRQRSSADSHSIFAVGQFHARCGAGTATSFKVDKRIMFIAEETDGAATVTSPTLTGVYTVFRVTNTSNGAQDFRIAGDNTQPVPVVNIFGRADAFDMQNFTLYVSAAACSTATMTTPAYAGEAATTFIGALGEDQCKYVFVRSDPVVLPSPPANGTASTIRLVVSASTTGSNGATLETQSGVADNPAAVDVVFAETGTANGNVANNGVSLAWDQYFVGTLTVTKTATVISDPISAAGQYKAIPGAVVEYTISVQNNGLVTSGASLTEIIPANTAYVAGSTTLNGVARADVAGAMPFVGGGSINSPSAAAGVINPGSTAAEIAVVRFRVTIN